MSCTDANVLLSYEVGQEIGRGAYGTVFKAKDRVSGDIVAIKTCRAVMHDLIDVRRTYREVAILQQLQHPNILQLLKVIPSTDDLHLVFQLMTTDLHTAIRAGVLHHLHKQYITAQLCSGVGYIHAAGVLHRDLKPQNILIRPDCNIKIADFGLSRLIPSPQLDIDVRMTEMCGTRWYLAPEVLQRNPYGRAADVWSLGITLCEMLVGKPILRGYNTVDQMQRTLEFLMPTLAKPGSGRTFEEKLRGQPRDAVDMARCLLQLVPESRATAVESLAMPYVKPYAERVSTSQKSEPVGMELSPDVDHPISAYQDMIAAFGRSKDTESESTSSHPVSQPSSAPVPVSAPPAEPEEPEEPVPERQQKKLGSALQEGFRRCGRLFGRLVGNRVMGALRGLGWGGDTEMVAEEPPAVYTREVATDDEMAKLIEQMGRLRVSAVVPSASYTVFTSAPAEGFQQCSEDLLLHLLDNAFGVPTATVVPPLKLDPANYFFEQGLISPPLTPRGELVGALTKRKLEEMEEEDEWLIEKEDVEGEGEAGEEQEPEGEPAAKEKEPAGASILETPKPHRLRSNTFFWTPTREMVHEQEGECVEALHSALDKHGVKATVSWRDGRHHLTAHAADKDKLEAVMKDVLEKFGGKGRVMTAEQKERQYKRQAFSAKKLKFHG